MTVQESTSVVEESTQDSGRQFLSLIVKCPGANGQRDALVDRSATELFSIQADVSASSLPPLQALAARLQVDRGLQTAPRLHEAGMQAALEPSQDAEAQCQSLTGVQEDEDSHPLHAHFLTEAMRLALPRVEAILLQNTHLNVVEDELARLGDDDGPAAGLGRAEATLAELQSFVDLSRSHGRAVSAIQWLPQRRGAFAVACTHAVPAGGLHGVLIWNLAHLIQPDYVLECPFEVGTFAINPGQPNMLAGGCVTGQVLLWDCTTAEEKAAAAAADRRTGADAKRVPETFAPAYQSSLEHSQRAPITDLQWLPGTFVTREGSRPPTAEESSRPGTASAFFASTAADGHVLFWDSRVQLGRRPEWRPLFAIALRAGLGTELPCACVSFARPAADAAVGGAAGADVAARNALVASHDGEIAVGSYARVEATPFPQEAAAPTARPDPDKAASAAAAAAGAAAGQAQPVKAHAGSIVALQRSPFVSNVVLTAGGWDWALWDANALDAPLMRSPAAPAVYLSAAWSPTRPGVLFAGRADGILEAWDLVERTHEPVLTCTASTTAVTSLAFSPPPPPSVKARAAQQQLLATGDAMGVVHVMEVPRSLRRPAHNEVKALGALVQRELARIQWLATHPPLAQAAAAPEAMNRQQGRQDDRRKESTEGRSLEEEEERIAELQYQETEAAFRAELGK